MSEEWDWPPKRRWEPEIRTLPSRQPRYARTIDHDPKAKNAWRWYLNQMRGGGSFLYKANVTAIAFTLWSAVIICVFGISFFATSIFIELLK